MMYEPSDRAVNRMRAARHLDMRGQLIEAIEEELRGGRLTYPSPPLPPPPLPALTSPPARSILEQLRDENPQGIYKIIFSLKTADFEVWDATDIVFVTSHKAHAEAVAAVLNLLTSE